MKFKDYFSNLADGYVQFRPGYPEELFAWLAGMAPQRKFAWDCACGSGQATVSLAMHFETVVGTDASEAQIKAAPEHPNIQWRAAGAHESGLPNESVDLVTVAQALHWFDLGRFYPEAYRVLRKGGVMAVWTYGVNQVEGEAVEEILHDFYQNVVGPYWPPERKLVESGYRGLPFPFEEFQAPAFNMQTRWNLPQLLGYVRTWSATGGYIADKGSDPVEVLAGKIEPLWGAPDQPRLVTWPLSMRVGRMRE